MFQSLPDLARRVGARPRFLVIAIALLALSSAAAVRAQVIDPSFPVVDRPVQALLLDGSTLYVGGPWWTGRVTGGGVPVDAVSGEVFPDWPVLGSVFAVVDDGAGGWYVGGTRGPAGGVFHVLADGSLDTWTAPSDGSVLALVRVGGTLYAGGQFAHIAGQPRGELAAFDTATGSLLPWAPAVGGSFPFVRALAANGSSVYVGGKFTGLGGQTRFDAGAVDAVTGAVTGWVPIPNESDTYAFVAAIAPSGAVVYLAGGFDSLGAVPRANLGAVDATTGAVLPWNPGLDQPGNALAVRGASVFVSGAFATAGGQPRSRLAEIDAASGAATTWIPALGSSRDVRCLALAGATLYAGGQFGTGPGAPTRSLAAIDASTGLLRDWNPGVTRNLDPGRPSTSSYLPVDCLAVAGATVFAGGQFNILGGVGGSGLAAVDVSIDRVLPWHPAVDGAVQAFARIGPVLYLGGYFTSVDGQPRAHLAAVDATTGALLPWNPGANNVVRALAVSGGTLYAGGDFTNAGAQARSRLAAFDTGTGALTGWAPAADGGVKALVAAGGVLYAGGAFTHVDAAGRKGVAAFDPATGLLTAWNPAGGSITALAVDGGTVLAGGLFTANGGTDKSLVAAIDSGTGAMTLWSPASSLYDPSQIFAVAISGLNALAGGQYYHMGSALRTALTEFDFPGGTLVPWQAGLFDSYCPDPMVFALATGGSSIFAGGCIAKVNDIPHGGLARWVPADAVAPSADVLSPDGLETFVIGTTRTLTWNASDDQHVQSVDLFVSRSGPQGPWELIASRLANTGSHDWLVTGPEAAGTACLRVVARDDAGNRVVDRSAAGFTMEDAAVPTLVELFRAEDTPAGVRIEWKFADPGAFANVGPERGTASAGEFAAVSAPRTVEGGVTRVLDRDATAGRTWWYRLAGARTGGGTFATAAIPVSAAGSLTEFALSPLAPNPTRGVSTLSFALPARARVRLTLVDVQGREVAVLADGERDAGRHVAALDARDLRPGLYFVRMQVAGVNLRQRVVIVR